MSSDSSSRRRRERTVLRGSGLSSSAAFEVLVAAIFEGLYASRTLTGILRAQLAQQAEILAQAETYRTSVVAAVKAESAYFSSINKEYAASPETVLMALYNQTLADVLEAQEGKYILGTVTGEDRKQVRLKINPEPPRLAKPANAEAE